MDEWGEVWGTHSVRTTYSRWIFFSFFIRSLDKLRLEPSGGQSNNDINNKTLIRFNIPVILYAGYSFYED